MIFKIIVLFVVIYSASAKNDDNYFEDGIFKEAVQFLDECGSKDLILCFKERALKYLELLPNDFNIGGVIQLKPNKVYRSARNYETPTLPEETKERDDALNNILIERVVDYLRSHVIEFKVPDETLKDFERSLEEGRKKKKKGSILPILILGKLKAIAIGAIALKTLALLAFKALVIAKVALTISLVIALKKLLEHKHSSTYEVVAHPHYEEHGHHDRSFGQDLAYRGHEGFRSSSNVHS